jgi:S-DNA-T family DNA segregation ATPase FtsK/SpoIIIE
VASQVDSKTILDVGGAEKLIGRGDMLYYPNGSMKFTRVQGGFVSDSEIESVVEFLASANSEYDECQDPSTVLNSVRPLGEKAGKSPDDLDEYFGKALAIAIESKQISASYLQRRLSVGYSRASRLIDQMEEHGYISSRDGNNPRHVLVDELPEEFADSAYDI